MARFGYSKTCLFKLPDPVTYYWPSRGGTSDVVPQCCMLCLYVYGLQQYEQLDNSCPLCILFCSVL